MVSSKNHNSIKILCSYDGRILPRKPDGKLRYIGGETRVVAVDRSISYIELLFKLAELYGSAVSFRCQLPQYDLDALVSVTSNEDLANVMEEYDVANQASGSQVKMRVFLCPLKSLKKVSPSSSPTSGVDFATRKYFYHPTASRMIAPPLGFPVHRARTTKLWYHTGVSLPRQSHLVHTGYHWQ